MRPFLILLIFYKRAILDGSFLHLGQINLLHCYLYIIFLQSGKIALSQQKSSSWSSKAPIVKVREPQLAKKSAFTSSQSSVEATSSPDLTPPSADSVNSQDCAIKKSLFTSPQACATKSLKRLSSERK